MATLPMRIAALSPTLARSGYMARQWQVYLSGEIHSDWREQIKRGAADLPVSFSTPVTDHGASDECGVQIWGAEDKTFWKDHKGA
jgi:YtoQ family protein